jgi:hypothetical protein
MYNFKRSLMALFGLLALIGVVAAITPFKGYGQQSPEAPAAVQDVRVVNATTTPVPTRNVDARRASDIVTLLSTNIGFRRVSANGVLAGAEFVVPADQVLIVTDVEWTSSCNNCTGSFILTLEVNGASGAHRAVYTSYTLRASDGRAGSSESMETGFAVAEGGRITVAPTISNASTTSVIYLHGYLVPAS